MSIREFHASTDLDNQNFAAVQQLRSAEAAPAIFDEADNLDQWDPWS